MYRTLIVDDEPQVRDLTSRALRRYQLECDVAADGDEAFAACERFSYDAVVTDLRMPRRHGHSLAVELLARKQRPKVIVVTGMSEPRLTRDLIGRGVDEVIHKPVDYNVLAMKVLELVQHDPPLQSDYNPTPAQSASDKFRLLAEIEKPLVDLTGTFADRLTGMFDLPCDLSDPPEAISIFINRQAEIEMADQAISGAPRLVHEERKKARLLCSATAIAVPVDSRFAACGELFKLAVRDVSESGMRLLHTRATNAEYLALSWAAETVPLQHIQIVARVMRCRPLSPFYDIGCQFVQAD